VYFGTNPATAHQLYTTFWKCIDLLDDINVTVDYVMTDGASTNRSFATMLFPSNRKIITGYLKIYISVNTAYVSFKISYMCSRKCGTT
jgi:hypothetical protein